MLPSGIIPEGRAWPEWRCLGRVHTAISNGIPPEVNLASEASQTALRGGLRNHNHPHHPIIRGVRKNPNPSGLSSSDRFRKDVTVKSMIAVSEGMRPGTSDHWARACEGSGILLIKFMSAKGVGNTAAETIRLSGIGPFA